MAVSELPAALRLERLEHLKIHGSDGFRPLVFDSGHCSEWPDFTLQIC
jgi:hypothetical protein